MNCLVPNLPSKIVLTVLNVLQSSRAFSISEGLESCYAITYRTTVIPLSTQQFISCDKDIGSYGCSGGTLRGAVDWLKV